MLPEGRTARPSLATIDADAMAQSLARGVRGDLVRRSVLSAAPVRLPCRHARCPRTGALRRHGAAPVLHHDARCAAGGAVRHRHDRQRAVVPGTRLAAREASAGGPAGRLPLLVLRPRAGLARRPQPALTALVPPLQRSAHAAAPRHRDPGGRQALLSPAARVRLSAHPMRTLSSGLMNSLSPGCTLKALYQASMLGSGPLTRNCEGLCTSDITSSRSAPSRYFSRHTCA